MEEHGLRTYCYPRLTLAPPPPFQLILLPSAVELPGKVVDLRSGFSHGVAILENGDVYIWGRMQGTKVKTDARVPVYEDQLYPRKVDIPGGGRAVEAFCSSFNTLLRMDDGRYVGLCLSWSFFKHSNSCVC